MHGLSGIGNGEDRIQHTQLINERDFNFCTTLTSKEGQFLLVKQAKTTNADQVLDRIIK